MLRIALIAMLALSSSFVSGACVPSTTPDQAARKTAEAEIPTFQAFLNEPLCEHIAVKYQLAGDYAIIGDFDKTFELAKEVAQADQGFDFPIDSPFDAGQFAPFKLLANCPEFTQIADTVRALHPPVHQSTSAFVIPDRTLIPEGLAYDERTQSFLMGSLNEKKIIRYAKDGTVSEFVPTGQNGLAEVLGIRMDPKDGSVWVASGENAQNAALFHFSPTGQFIGKYPPPGDKSDHLFNDLVVCRDGDIFLTDSYANEVYVLPHGQSTLVPLRTARSLCYPNGIALTPDDRTVFIADAFGVLVLDRTNSSTRPIQPGAHITLSGFDGLYTWRDCLVGVQNSLGSPRVALVRLSADRTQTAGITLPEYRTQFTQLPTTGAVVGDTFYYITNSQFDHYQDGKLLKPNELAPIVVAKVALRE